MHLSLSQYYSQLRPLVFLLKHSANVANQILSLSLALFLSFKFADWGILGVEQGYTISWLNLIKDNNRIDRGEMEKEEGKTQRVTTSFTGVFQTNFQWGSRKRPRCVKVKEEDASVRSDGGCGGGGSSGGIRKKITSRVIRAEKEIPISLSPNCLVNKNSSDSAVILRSNGVTENWKSQSCSPEKGEDRYYTTRGSLLGFEDNGKIFMEAGVTEDKGFVWPKLFISLSSKEKEEDFMAMKGCKLPQRPKKRAKFIQRSLLLVSPGAWLSDLCQERYEVREKKTSKKRPRGLKAMGSMDSDSE